MRESKPIEILLVEDNAGDARLAREALREAKVRNNLTWLSDGEEALAFLRRKGKYSNAPRPDLILLDLNLPRKDGREVLSEIKADDNFRRIPVVILTTSQAEEDILKAYHLNANCYIPKPVDLERFAFATLHRPSNVDDRAKLAAVVSALEESARMLTAVLEDTPDEFLGPPESLLEDRVVVIQHRRAERGAYLG